MPLCWSATCVPRRWRMMCEISDVGPVSVSTMHTCTLVAAAQRKKALRLGSPNDYGEVHRERPGEPVQVAHNQHYHGCSAPLHFEVRLHGTELHDDGRCQATEERTVPCNFI